MKLVTNRIILALFFAIAINTPVLANIIEPPEAFIIKDTPLAHTVLTGQYDQAIAQSSIVDRTTINLYDRAAAKINLCVAYLKTGMFDAAEASCLSAQDMASRVGKEVTLHYAARKRGQRQLLAVSNKNLELIKAYR